ncbi:MAG: hypothetical protein ACRCXC_08255 [Legionella sp.]
MDVFIAMQSANNFYELDFEIRALAKWLYTLNHALRATSSDLVLLYEETPKEDISFELARDHSEVLAECCRMLVSLLTTQFEFSVFVSQYSFSLWDKPNTVFSEARGIFTI